MSSPADKAKVADAVADQRLARLNQGLGSLFTMAADLDKTAAELKDHKPAEESRKQLAAVLKTLSEKP